jgi:hypothetical protein
VARAKKETAPVPVQVFLDTCVWLDMAGNEANEPLLGAIESLCREKIIELVVPQIVCDEFDRNKARIVKESGSRRSKDHMKELFGGSSPQFLQREQHKRSLAGHSVMLCPSAAVAARTAAKRSLPFMRKPLMMSDIGTKRT